MGEFKPEFNEKNQEKVNGEWVYTAKSIVRELGCTMRQANEVMKRMEADWQIKDEEVLEISENNPIRLIQRNDITRRPFINIINDDWFESEMYDFKHSMDPESYPKVINKKDEEVKKILNLKSDNPIKAYMALYGCNGRAARRMMDYREEINALQLELQMLREKYNEIEKMKGTRVFPLYDIQDDRPPEHEVIIRGKKDRGIGMLSLSDYVSLEEIRDGYEK